MRPEDIAFAQRLVLSPRWHWMPGMAMVRQHCGPVRVVADWDQIVAAQGTLYRAGDPAMVGDYGDAYPDLDDPATQGCLRVMLDEACGGDLDIELHDPNLWAAVTFSARSIASDSFGVIMGNRGHVLARALLAEWTPWREGDE